MWRIGSSAGIGPPSELGNSATPLPFASSSMRIASSGLTAPRYPPRRARAASPDRMGYMSSLPLPAFDAPRRVLLAAPRGYCAGVERAIDIVEVALAPYGPPVYVRKQIVHNLHVVRDLETRGAVFVDELDQVPEGATV